MAETVLLADESVTMRRVVQLTLEEQGFDVVAVADGQEALDALATTHPSLALISVSLQAVDGFAVARAMRNRPDVPGVPVLLLAGAFDTIDDARVQESGAVGVLIKPYEPGLVIRRVKELLGMSTNAPGSDAASASVAGRLVTSQEPQPDARPGTAHHDTELRAAESTQAASGRQFLSSGDVRNDVVTPVDSPPASGVVAAAAPPLAGVGSPDSKPVWEHPQDVAAQSSDAMPSASPASDDDYLGELGAVFDTEDVHTVSGQPPAQHSTDAAPPSSASSGPASERREVPSLPPSTTSLPKTQSASDNPAFAAESKWFGHTPSAGEPRRGMGTPDMHTLRGQRPDDAPSVPMTQASFSAAMPAADAFAALLAVEQGEMPSTSPGSTALDLTDETLAQLSDRVAGDLGAHLSNALPDRIIQGVAAKLTDGLSNRLSHDLNDRLTALVAERLSGPVADRLAAGLAERVAELVAERMMQSSFGESLQQTVRETSERLVREEIDRIRARAASQ